MKLRNANGDFIPPTPRLLQMLGPQPPYEPPARQGEAKTIGSPTSVATTAESEKVNDINLMGARGWGGAFVFIECEPELLQNGTLLTRPSWRLFIVRRQ